MAISSNLFTSFNPYADGLGGATFGGFSPAAPSSILDDLAAARPAPPSNPVDTVSMSHTRHSHHKPVHGRTHVS
ncbi:hypothetical protein JST97_35700 [bacterium]|nr:hypothetical protein [bacterium]